MGNPLSEALGVIFPAEPGARINQGIGPDLIWWMTLPYLVGMEGLVLQCVLEGRKIGRTGGPERDHIHGNFVRPVVVISSRGPKLTYHSHRPTRAFSRSPFIGQGL